ncbi:MAG: acid shock protein [Faecousia sp.]
MKKIIAMLLALTMVLAFAGCAKTEAPVETTAAPVETTAPVETEAAETEAPETEAPAVAAMTHEEYIAADMDAAVTVETYVQGHQSWWDNKITVYCQSPDGAYFLYELACSEEDAAKLVPGTKIRVSGYKGEWAGEVEIMDGTFEFVDDGETYIAEPLDVTDLLGTDALIEHQNEFVSFTGMTVEAIEYKNGEPGDDIYVTLGVNGASYSFCVEVYLTGTDSDVYTTVGELEVGDVVNVEGFLYWYEGVNPHITAISVAE